MEGKGHGRGGSKRLTITLCVFAYVLLGVPVWWSLTSINRPQLPHALMQQASGDLSNLSVSLPTSVVVYVVGDGMPPDSSALAKEMYAQISQQADQPQKDAEDLLHLSIIHETLEGCSYLTWPLKATQAETPGPHSHVHHAPPRPSPPCLRLHHLLGQLQQLHQTAAGSAAGMDALLHKHLQALGAAQGGQYYVFALPLTQSQTPQDAPAAEAGTAESTQQVYQLIFGQYRHAWLWYPGSTSSTSSSTASSAAGGAGSDGGLSEGGQVHARGEENSGSVQQQVQEVLVHVAAPAVGRSFASQPGKEPARLPISPAGQTTLSFWLCNAEPDSMMSSSSSSSSTRGFSTWNFPAFEALYLQPIMRALAPVAELSVVSQVLLHAPARTHGKWIPALGAYVIEPAQLPFFVDSDWSLDFGVPAVPLDTQQGGGGDSSGIPRAGAQSCGAGGGVCFGDLNDQQHAGQGGEGVQQQEFRSSACGAGSGVGGREGAGECPADGSHAHATRRIDAVDDADRMGRRQGRLGGEHANHVPAHTLHMVLYVPPASHRPMLLLERRAGDALPTNSFWIPHWGGVHVMNVGVQKEKGEEGGEGSGAEERQQESRAQQGSEQKVQPDRGEVAGHELGMDALHGFAEVAVAQLRVLLGLQAYPEVMLQQSIGRSSSRSSSGEKGSAGLAVRALPALDSGLAEWEVDVLMRRRVGRDIEAASRVLGSLSRTVLALPNLEMPDIIGQQVHEALDALHLAMLAAKEGDYIAAGREARAAHASAEAAFSHPAILAQLSFPESHKLGVYMPLFFPALLTVMLALLREVQHHVQCSRKAGKG